MMKGVAYVRGEILEKIESEEGDLYEAWLEGDYSGKGYSRKEWRKYITKRLDNVIKNAQSNIPIRSKKFLLKF